MSLSIILNTYFYKKHYSILNNKQLTGNKGDKSLKWVCYKLFNGAWENIMYREGRGRIYSCGDLINTFIFWEYRLEIKKVSTEILY